MTEPRDTKRYRPNVGLALFHREGLVFLGKRAGAEGPYQWQMPQGGVDRGESTMEAAYRELEEEIGVLADHIEEIASFYVSPGFLTEKMHVYLATGLTVTEQNLEIDEILEVERHSFPDAFVLIRNGGIEDAKTMLGLILSGPRFGFTF